MVSYSQTVKLLSQNIPFSNCANHIISLKLLTTCSRVSLTVDELIFRNECPMTQLNPKMIVIAFVDAINSRDVGAMEQLMCPNHVFIDSPAGCLIGREQSQSAWQNEFRWFPQHTISIDRIIEDDDTIVLMGAIHESATRQCQMVPAVWTARVQHNRVVEWRTYTGTITERVSRAN